MAYHEEMASIYKNGGVPAEITTDGEGGTLIAPGPDLTAYIGRLLDKRTQSNSSKRSSGGDMNQNVDPKKQRVEITWWRKFKYYGPSYGINLHNSTKKYPKRKRIKTHDRLWMQWCELITLEIHKDCGEGEVR